MAVEGVITLGIGSAPGSVRPFITLGLEIGEGGADPPVSRFLTVSVASADAYNQLSAVSSKNDVEVSL